MEVIIMTTISLRIDNELSEKLEKVGRFMERSKSFIARKAIESYIEEMAFLAEAKERYEDKKAKYIDYEKFKKQIGID
jgi:predicted transcriptional regulator